MSTSTRRTAARLAATAIAGFALILGTAAAPANADSRNPHWDDAGGHRHPYSVSGGVVHVRPQTVPRSPAKALAATLLQRLDAHTELAWSQFSDDFSGSHLMLERGDGTGQIALTPSTPGVYVYDPHLSPDGRSVLFERDRPDGVDVVVMGVDGTNERVIPLGCTDQCLGDIAPTWGADGRSIWFTRVLGPIDDAGNAKSAVLWTADLSGRNVRRVSAPGIDGIYEEYTAKFLPSGDRVIIRLRNSLDGVSPIQNVLVRFDRSGREHVLTDWTISADIFDTSPALVGPTAGLVVFESYGHGAPDGSAQAVATVPTDCASTAACMARVRYLTPTAMDPVHPAENYNPTWSPDGLRIAYVHAYYGTDADPAFGADIWTMLWNGSQARAFTNAPEWDYRPEWAFLPH